MLQLSRVALDPDDPPPNYLSLARLRGVVVLGLTVSGCVCALWRVSVVQPPLWFGYLGASGALVWVDFKTTWLPKRLHQIATAQMTVGLAVVTVHSPGVLVMALVRACVISGVFWLVRQFSGSFGFGDTRLELLVGAVTGSMGLQVWTTALPVGTLIGTGRAIVHALRGCASEPLPYGPSLWLSPAAATVLAGGG